jgi:type III secretion protein O
MSIFKELLSIKAFREDKAEMAVRKQRTILAEAVAAREAAEKALEDFKQWAVAQERSLYDQLCRQVVKLRAIEEVQLEVAGMRGKETQHEDQVRDAEAQRVKQAEQLEADRRTLQDATRMKEKFVELARINTEEHLKELERKEDAELEEAAETRRDRADWDEREEEPA